MEADFVGYGPAIAVLRHARGWTQERLSEASDVPQGTLSKLESGVAELTRSQLLSIATALAAPVELLQEESLVTAGGVSCIHHRRRRSRLTIAATRRVEAVANLTSLTVSRWIDAAPADDRPDLWTPTSLSPEEMARYVRAEWGLGSDPMQDVAGLVESSGVPIVRRPLLGPTPTSISVPQDGVSFRSQGRRPVIIVNEPIAGDRDRFTVAHEWGHILLHGIEVAIDDDDLEDEANRFAGELLLPSSGIGPQLSGLTESRFRDLLELKARWRCSVAAIVEQGRRIGSIDAATYRAIRVRITKMGWHKIEPGAFPRDPILMIGRVCRRLTEMGLEASDLARVGMVSDQLFEQVYAPLIAAETSRMEGVK